MDSGIIFDIKKYAINDGPGIRTTIFFKGCNLQCKWCHNPESMSTKVQKMYNKDKCLMCGGCEQSCPEGAITLTPNGIITDKEKCIVCGGCAEVCPSLGTEMSGKDTTINEIMDVIEKEQIFYDQSDGGVTFSGGEPLMHSSFLINLLDECGKRGIHRTVDTTGFAKTETLLEVAKRTDLFLYDLKMIDSEKHKEWTSVNNELIINNLKVLAETGAEINIRIPLIKGVNDDEHNLVESAKLIASLSGDAKKINILPYHNIAQKKYEKLGEKYDSGEMTEPSKDELENITNIFKQYNLVAEVGG